MKTLTILALILFSMSTFAAKEIGYAAGDELYGDYFLSCKLYQTNYYWDDNTTTYEITTSERYEGCPTWLSVKPNTTTIDAAKLTQIRDVSGLGRACWYRYLDQWIECVE